MKTKEHLINVGSGKEFSIKKYANFIISELKLNLKIKFDKNKPDGTSRKLLNSSVASGYGWYPKVSLKEGFFETYKDFIKNK